MSYIGTCDKWIPVTTAWRVFRLGMEKRPPVRKVAANILNKQLQTADKGWSCSLGFRRGAKTYLVTKYSHRKHRTRIDTLVRIKQWKKGM